MQETYVAHSIIDKPSPPLLIDGEVPSVPFEKINVRMGIFPIAETSTLPSDYYDNVHLDTRYPIDHLIASTINTTGKDARVSQQTIGVLGSIATEALEPWRQIMMTDVSISRFDIKDKNQFISLCATFLKAPSELREFAYSYSENSLLLIEEISNLEGINSVVDLDGVLSLLREQVYSIDSSLEQIKDKIEMIILEQRAAEDKVILSGSPEGIDLQNARIERKRLIADGIDASMCRLGSNSGAIVDPAYLLDDTHYKLLRDEPEVSLDTKINFLRHMMSGHWALGQDHTFIYRNSKENMAATHVGVIPDYAVTRPGNFIYHDLKLLEHGPFKKNFPTRTLYAYIRNHYLRQMDLALLDENRQPYADNWDLSLPFEHQGERYVAPLQYNSRNVIPFRALKKSEQDSHYYEYGAECYMAELVDIALQLDAIYETEDAQETINICGDISIGIHTIDLLEDLYYSATNESQAAALAVEQILFMEGKVVVGGRQIIHDILHSKWVKGGFLSKLAQIKYEQELKPDNTPQPARSPLTCYYEWFQKYSRPVPFDEMKRKGLPMHEPLFVVSI